MSRTTEGGTRERTMNGSTGSTGSTGSGTHQRPVGRSTEELRERAAEVSGEILNRLADPAATMAATRIPARAAADGVGGIRRAHACTPETL